MDNRDEKMSDIPMSLVEQYNKELYHYGVKGMKWGVRRYQNYDGTLTAAGKARRINGVAKGEPMTSDEADSGKCNPNKPDKWTDYEEYKKQLSEKGGYVYNCQSCAVTYEARIRGYDVIAGSRSNNPTADMIQDDISKAFVDPVTGKPPITTKIDCGVSEELVKRYEHLMYTVNPFNDPSGMEALDKAWNELYNSCDGNVTYVDKMLNETVKQGERYLAKTRTINYDSGDYREHYMVHDWTNTKEPMAIETQSKHTYPEEVFGSKDDGRFYLFALGADNADEAVLGVELTRVDNCDLNYDVVEKVTERSKRE